MRYNGSKPNTSYQHHSAFTGETKVEETPPIDESEMQRLYLPVETRGSDRLLQKSVSSSEHLFPINEEMRIGEKLVIDGSEKSRPKLYVEAQLVRNEANKNEKEKNSLEEAKEYITERQLNYDESKNLHELEKYESVEDQCERSQHTAVTNDFRLVTTEDVKFLVRDFKTLWKELDEDVRFLAQESKKVWNEIDRDELMSVANDLVLFKERGMTKRYSSEEILPPFDGPSVKSKGVSKENSPFDEPYLQANTDQERLPKEISYVFDHDDDISSYYPTPLDIEVKEMPASKNTTTVLVHSLKHGMYGTSGLHQQSLMQEESTLEAWLEEVSVATDSSTISEKPKVVEESNSKAGVKEVTKAAVTDTTSVVVTDGINADTDSVVVFENNIMEPDYKVLEDKTVMYDDSVDEDIMEVVHELERRRFRNLTRPLKWVFSSIQEVFPSNEIDITLEEYEMQVKKDEQSREMELESDLELKSDLDLGSTQTEQGRQPIDEPDDMFVPELKKKKSKKKKRSKKKLRKLQSNTLREHASELDLDSELDFPKVKKRGSKKKLRKFISKVLRGKK